LVVTIPAGYAAADMARRRGSYNEKEPLPGSLGEWIRRRRKELGFSQQELADRMVELGGKYEQSDVSKQEVPGTKIPRPRGMRTLAFALEVSVDELNEAAAASEDLYGRPVEEIGSSFASGDGEKPAPRLIEWEDLSDEEWIRLTRLREETRRKNNAGS
jgi:transcriptional regulator with XRE-family HTH domain